MCVHYAVTFVAACVAVGIPARAAVLVDHASGKSGHFVAEVWLADAGRWIMVDPNLDAMFFDGERPMTIDEIQASGDLPGQVRWGAGTAWLPAGATRHAHLGPGHLPDGYLLPSPGRVAEIRLPGQAGRDAARPWLHRL